MSTRSIRRLLLDLSVAAMLAFAAIGTACVSSGGPERQQPSSGLSQAPLPEKSAAAGAAQIDIDDLLRECQKVVRGVQYTGIVQWLPAEFWLAASPHTPEEVAAERSYTMFAVAVARIQTMGLRWVSKGELRSHVVFRDSSGTEYAPLEGRPPDVHLIPFLFKAMMASVLGQLGEHTEVMIFPAKNRNGEPIADATRRGSFSLVFREIAGPGESIFEWQLPLTSVSPPKFCPAGGERVEAHWNYCPFHGAQLN